MPLDSAEVLGLFRGRRLTRGPQKVNRGLDHVQRIAEFMGDTRGDLAKIR